MKVEEQAVLDWLDKNKIYYLIDEAILLPDYEIALRVVEREDGASLIWRELLENQGWDVVNLLVGDLQTRLDETMRKALKGV